MHAHPMGGPMLQALVFDLDDTLYIEKDYVKSGYRAVARHLESMGCCEFEAAFATMARTLEMSGRQMVFPVLLERLTAVSLSITELVEIYRKHTPSIELLPGYLQLLERLHRSHKLGIITDGLPEVQRRKVLALGLRDVCDHIIYTWEYGSEKQKPHPISFSMMLENLNVSPDTAIFVGDNPEKDCRGAHGIGMRAVQIRSRSWSEDQIRVTNQEAPEFVIDTLHELPQILQQIN